MALGASASEVDRLIGLVKSAGFPIPPEVDVRTWRYWIQYGYDGLSYHDVADDASPEINYTYY